MYSEALETLIEAVLADGVITDKEWAVLRRRAEAEGVDFDELEVIVEARLVKRNGGQTAPTAPAPPMPAAAAVTPAPAAPAATRPSGPPPVPTDTKNPSTTKSPSPQTQKYGTLEKCPNCGTVVEAGTVRCEACGYAFRGVEANSSVERLSALLREADEEYSKRKQKMGFLSQLDNSQTEHQNRIRNIVNTFPIPSTKEDLLEFIMYLEPKAHAKGLDGYMNRYYYKNKYNECIRKAEFFFADDPDFQRLIFNINGKKEKKSRFGGLFGK